MTSGIRYNAGTILLKPDKEFFRLDRPFSDAVRSGKELAITDVLLRADLPGARARRMAENILSETADSP